MKFKLPLIALLLINLTFAQNYKFGKVSEEELMETSNTIDPDASATVLYKKHKIYFSFDQDEGFKQVNFYQERIKIYNKEGFEWANRKIKLYDKNNTNKEKLTGLRAYTYTLENNKVKKTKLKKEGIFEEKKNKYWATTAITMPNINPGCIIEIEYEIHSPFMSIDDIIVQYDIPIKKLDLDVVIPEYFNYKKIANPKASFYPKFETYKKARREMLSTKSRTFNQTKFQNSNAEFVENGFKVNMENIPALEKEPLVDNRDNYRSKILMEYEYYKNSQGQVTLYTTDWAKVTKNIFDYNEFGGQLDKKKYFENEIDGLIGETTDPIERAYLIYNFIKDKVKWNGFVGYTAEKGVKKAYKEGSGNVADINLMLTSMLRYAGLPANPVLLSTRDNGIPIVPSTSGFNYVIAAIEFQNKIILLDASSKYSNPNVLPERILNWQGRIIRERGSSAWVSLAPANKSNEVVSVNFNINNDLSINGMAREQLTHNLALKYRNAYANASNRYLVEKLENKMPGLEVSNLEVKNSDVASKPIRYSYKFNIDSAVEDIGGNLYFSPLLYLATSENIFKQDTRHYPIDFVHPIKEKYLVNISLPAGYVVESMPESTKINFDDNKTNFSYIAKKNGEKSIQLIINFDINGTIILPEEYEKFKQFFQILVDKQSEKIVLKKV